MRTLALLVEYDGTSYRGWQRQAGAPSVQARLEDAIAALTGERPPLTVAGRTDAGVHAVGQVCSFPYGGSLPTQKFCPGLNHYLPTSISVHQAVEAPGFDARRDALAKTYRYRVYHGAAPAALEVGHSWQRRGALDVAAMGEAARGLVGEHDFESFRSAQCDAPHARRNLFSVEVVEVARPPQGRCVDIVLRGNAFCRHMCRIIAGTLVQHGQGMPCDMAAILAARDRAAAGITAPAAGLTLVSVVYAQAVFCDASRQ
jgi:tRNA pseudouridine38-40 synthase